MFRPMPDHSRREPSAPLINAAASGGLPSTVQQVEVDEAVDNRKVDKLETEMSQDISPP